MPSRRISLVQMLSPVPAGCITTCTGCWMMIGAGEDGRICLTAGSASTRCTATLLLPSSSCALASKSRSEEHTSELQSLMRISYAVFCLKNKNYTHEITHAAQE